MTSRIPFNCGVDVLTRMEAGMCLGRPALQFLRYLIPEESMKHPDYAEMFKRLRGMGFNGDGASNGIFLPANSQSAKNMGLPGH